MMKTKSGFTLIELLVVCALIIILATIASINGKAWLDRYRVEYQMKNMYADLANARISAMQRKRAYFVTFLSSAAIATQYTVYEDSSPSPDGNGTLETGTDAVVTQTNLSPYAVSSSVGRIDFDMRGLVSTPTHIKVINFASYNAAYDCISVSTTVTRLGKMRGADCEDE